MMCRQDCVVILNTVEQYNSVKCAFVYVSMMWKFNLKRKSIRNVPFSEAHRVNI